MPRVAAVYFLVSQANGGAVLLVFQGLATGSLLYVVFFEILEKERSKDVNGFAQAISMTSGYIFMILLAILEANSGSDEDSSAASRNGTYFNGTVFPS